MADEIEPKKIMTKPLPQILDEIDNSIKLANQATKNAREVALPCSPKLSVGIERNHRTHKVAMIQLSYVPVHAFTF